MSATKFSLAKLTAWSLEHSDLSFMAGIIALYLSFFLMINLPAVTAFLLSMSIVTDFISVAMALSMLPLQIGKLSALATATIVADAWVLVRGYWFVSGNFYHPVANLIVRQENSKEMSFLKNAWQYCQGKLTDKKFYEQCKGLSHFSGLLLAEIFFIYWPTGRWPKFLSYCFDGYFTWLGIYIAGKFAIDKTPVVVAKLEKFKKPNEDEPLQPKDLLISYSAKKKKVIFPVMNAEINLTHKSIKKVICQSKVN